MRMLALQGLLVVVNIALAWMNFYGPFQPLPSAVILGPAAIGAAVGALVLMYFQARALLR